MSFFEKAREAFADYVDRMEFRKLDITKKPEDQGFKPHSYDMVVASSVLHATPKLAETMANVRSLLKPGGQVVICEATYKEHNRTGFLFGLFPDWWAGVDEGRDLGPFATYPEWDAVLKQTGFGGIECRQTDAECYLFPNTLFTARAINADYLRLANPLSAPLKEHYPQLVVVGGQTPHTAIILAEIQHLLPHRQVLNIKQLRDVKARHSEIDTKSTFIVLSELDQEFFSDLDETTFESFKSVFYFANNSLWLTENGWIDHPRQAMMIGALRSIRLEHTDINVQCLDVDDVQTLNIKLVVEQVLRLEEASLGVAEGMMWTTEPEIYVSKGRALVPRIKHDMDRNNRLNSKRRPIVTQVNHRNKPVALQQQTSGKFLELAESVPAPVGSAPEATLTTIHVAYSLAKAIRVGNTGFWYLVQGRVAGSDDDTVVALSETNASIVQVISDRIFPCSSSVASDSPALLVPVAARLLTRSILARIPSGASILLLEPPAMLLDSITQAAKERNVRLYLASASSVLPKSTASWIQLHPRESDRRLRDLIPARLSAFFDFSTGSLGHRIAAHLPTSCFTFAQGHLIQDLAASVSSEEQVNTVQISPEDLQSDVEAHVTLVPVDQAAKLEDLSPSSISTVIDWRADGPVAARLRPIDSVKLFVQDKTYLLVGLGGSIGRSLAYWMVEHGARHVVLSSRNPEVPDPEWMKDVERLGGVITVLPMCDCPRPLFSSLPILNENHWRSILISRFFCRDVSKEDSLDTGLSVLRKTLPAIGGIAYGPLVLKDALLRNMELETMNVVLRSKIIGAQLLHDRFCDAAAENPLDFFIMFSSAAGTGGNPGQSNYTAANAYLQGLAQQRRTKGLAVSDPKRDPPGLAHVVY